MRIIAHDAVLAPGADVERISSDEGCGWIRTALALRFRERGVTHCVRETMVLRA
jgi:hypothetical protein